MEKTGRKLSAQKKGGRYGMGQRLHPWPVCTCMTECASVVFPPARSPLLTLSCAQKKKNLKVSSLIHNMQHRNKKTEATSPYWRRAGGRYGGWREVHLIICQKTSDPLSVVQATGSRDNASAGEVLNSSSSDVRFLSLDNFPRSSSKK